VQRLVVLFALQAAAYASSDGILTEPMVDEIVAEAVRAHRKKFDWRVEQEGRDAVTSPASSSLRRSAKDLAAFMPPSGAPHPSAS